MFGLVIHWMLISYWKPLAPRTKCSGRCSERTKVSQRDHQREPADIAVAAWEEDQQQRAGRAARR